MKVLISGAAGRLAHMVADLLKAEGDEVVGLDVRPLPFGRTFPGTFHQVKRYDQRGVAEVFRRHRPEGFIHLGIRAATARARRRYTQNVLGTRKLLDYCRRYEVKRVVAMSTFHVYGAHQHNPVNIREDAPLRATMTFPELQDIVDLDHTVSTFLWRNRDDVNTVLLRPVNIVGPRLQNQMSRLLRSRRCPRLLGFNPLMQFLHEDDAGKAIVMAMKGEAFGVYNVAGEGAVPFLEAIRLAGGRPLAVPHILAYPIGGFLARRGRMPPAHLIDYFRYAVLIDDKAFRDDFGFEPRYNTVETLHWAGTRSR